MQFLDKHYDVVIIGAGAAGMMCAIEAGKRGRTVLLIDHNKKPGEKIRISGGGRCNFTNLTTKPENFISQNPHFCKSALKRFGPQDFVALVEKHHIPYHEKEMHEAAKGQLFCDHKSDDILDMLLREMHAVGVVLALNINVGSVAENNARYQLQLFEAGQRGADGPRRGQSLTSESLVIATGGKSIPKMGATGFGYKIAQQFGLNIIEPRAALVPLRFDDEFVRDLGQLSGISCDTLISNDHAAFRDYMLLTHRGLSGPAILQISSYWYEGEEIKIDLCPGRNMADTLLSLKAEQPRLSPMQTLVQFLPKRLAQYFCAQVWPNKNTAPQLGEIANKVLQSLGQQLNQWQVKPLGSEGFRTAEVTLGGVDTKDLSSKSFEARAQANLYFIGEVVDVTGHLGGYNFQWAWASGFAAGQFV